MEMKYDVNLSALYSVIILSQHPPMDQAFVLSPLLKLNEMCMWWFLTLKLNACVNYNYYVLELNI